MIKMNYKKFLTSSLIVLAIFFIDRISKIYVLNLAQQNDILNMYITSYFNLYLIWNKGIAFGLFSFDTDYIYNLITIIIIIVIIIIIAMIINANSFKKYLLLGILGGSLGNVFDRIYYSAVPDFIDFHINEFHWFVFNIADIFITLGVIGLIFDEIIYSIKKNEKN
ncbi:signal peptidase II [Candidatus Pelagibacter bacterium]|jgi:signal peptidase II|nr:signal peptidase II [Candidatus Pelagibacter bacterium]